MNLSCMLVLLHVVVVVVAVVVVRSSSFFLSLSFIEWTRAEEKEFLSLLLAMRYNELFVNGKPVSTTREREREKNSYP